MRAAMLLIAEEVPTWLGPAALSATTVTGTWHMPMPSPIRMSGGMKPIR